MARTQSKQGSRKPARKPVVKKRPATTPKKGGKKPGRRGVGKSRDKETLKKIRTLGDGIVADCLDRKDPSVEIPIRSVSNMKYNRKKRILEMGTNTQCRNLFNLGQAKKFMQMTLHANSCRDLIGADKTLSLRGMYYKGLHTIEGTKEQTFFEQSESDGILEDLEVTLNSLREELHIFAKKRGTMVGNITVIDSGDEIDCRRMGTGGYAIPSICEPEVLQFGACEATFVLHVEKDTVWSRFNEDRFWENHNCILTEGSGQPPRGVRRLLHRLHNELGLPIYCLLDCDPWGHYIYSVIKQGSINLAFESQRMAVPEARFMGIRSSDFEACDLPDEVKILLNDNDVKRAKQIMNYDWFSDKREWKREIRQMLKNGFKMEVESLITKDISYVTEVYVPDRLRRKDFLD